MEAQVNEKSTIHVINENRKYPFIVNTLLIEGIYFLYRSKNKNLYLEKCFLFFYLQSPQIETEQNLFLRNIKLCACIYPFKYRTK